MSFFAYERYIYVEKFFQLSTTSGIPDVLLHKKFPETIHTVLWFFFPVPSGFHGCYKPPIISTGQWFCKYFKILLLCLGVKPVFEFVSLTEGCACLTFFHPLILGASLISPSCFLRENPIPKVVQHRSCQNFLCCLSCSSVFGEDLGEFPFSWDSAPAVHMWMGLSLAFTVFSWLLFSFCQDGNCCVKPFFF